MRYLFAVALALLLVLGARPSSAAVHRYALVVGNDRGESGDVTLRYAETDAQRVYDVLKDLGGFEPADMLLLLGEGAPRVQASLIALNDRIRASIASGAEVLLVVYYSGHADADALHTSGSRFDLVQLEQLVRGSAATFRVLVVDACRSGALTRLKGGSRSPPFSIRVDEHLDEQGLVYLTSSSANEDAQESDVLKGSFFTHYFVSALLGAGDADGDGRVTLEEAYRYAYDGTLRSSSQTWAGIQHPTFRYEIRGAGRLPITTLPGSIQSRATITFPNGRTYLLMKGSDRGAVVGEVSDVTKARRLSVPPGHYFVRGRSSDVLLEGELELAPGGSAVVADYALHRIAYARLVRKGGSDLHLSHGPEVGYLFRTALPNSRGLCQGAFGGYSLHFEAASIGARLSGCRSSFANDVLSGEVTAWDTEVRVLRAFDLPFITLDLGVGAGVGFFRQSFETRGYAPPRTTPFGSIAALLGLGADIAAGFSVRAEASLVTDFYVQENERATASSFGPSVAYRQTIGIGKAW